MCVECGAVRKLVCTMRNADRLIECYTPIGGTAHLDLAGKHYQTFDLPIAVTQTIRRTVFIFEHKPRLSLKLLVHLTVRSKSSKQTCNGCLYHSSADFNSFVRSCEQH